MIHELRVYRCVPGRLPDLNKRFESVTLKLWEKHGFRPVGFWTTVLGESNQDLTYLLEWKDLAERERVWAGFMSDQEWLKALDGIVEDVSSDIENYRFYLAGEKLYHLVWNTVADTLIEEMKSRLLSEDVGSKLSAQYTLMKTLETCLILLHPFMPFVTESIWQNLPHDLKKGEQAILMVAKWPKI